MSLDVDLVTYTGGEEAGRVVLYESNITHNLSAMADAAGLYSALWHPASRGYRLAEDLIPDLRKGLARLQSAPDYFRTFDSKNGWGLYENFVPFVADYLAACERHPKALVEVSR